MTDIIKDQAKQAVEEDKSNKEPQELSPNAYDVQLKEIELREERRKERRIYCSANKHKIRAVIISIIVVLLLFNVGFWRTLGILIVLVVGYSLGAYFDKDREYFVALKRLKDILS